MIAEKKFPRLNSPQLLGAVHDGHLFRRGNASAGNQPEAPRQPNLVYIPAAVTSARSAKMPDRSTQTEWTLFSGSLSRTIFGGQEFRDAHDLTGGASIRRLPGSAVLLRFFNGARRSGAGGELPVLSIRFAPHRRSGASSRRPGRLREEWCRTARERRQRETENHGRDENHDSSLKASTLRIQPAEGTLSFADRPPPGNRSATHLPQFPLIVMVDPHEASAAPARGAAKTSPPSSQEFPCQRRAHPDERQSHGDFPHFGLPVKGYEELSHLLQQSSAPTRVFKGGGLRRNRFVVQSDKITCAVLQNS